MVHVKYCCGLCHKNLYLQEFSSQNDNRCGSIAYFIVLKLSQFNQNPANTIDIIINGSNFNCYFLLTWLLDAQLPKV